MRKNLIDAVNLFIFNISNIPDLDQLSSTLKSRTSSFYAFTEEDLFVLICVIQIQERFLRLEEYELYL